jgi:trk system potassium uptake protein TrkA
MNVLIVGAGKSGTYLAEKLRQKHKVTMVEARADRVAVLAPRMPEVRFVRGDGCEPSVLDRADAQSADLVAALTGDDEDNLVVSFLSKTTHRVPMVFARTNHPKNEWLFTRRWGVDVAVSAANVIADLIEKEVSLGDMITLLRLSAQNMVIEEITLPDDALCVGSQLADLSLPKCTHIMAIISGGDVVIPRGDTTLRGGDEILIISSCGEESDVLRCLGVHHEER